MNESSKTNRIRQPDFARVYLGGSVLDIGAGADVVCPWARSFDVMDGDANKIDEYLPLSSFDAIHSSHCLEHMLNPREALLRWWSLLKPGGYLILVVPEETLYEQHIWPSFFNSDHKATFRLDGQESWSPVSIEVRELVSSLPMAEIVSAEVQDKGYVHELCFPSGLSPRKVRHPLKALVKLLRVIPLCGHRLQSVLLERLVGFGYPLDQTRGEALAQIQVIARKKQN